MSSRIRVLLFALVVAIVAGSASVARDVPEKHIPQTVLMELLVVEGQFKTALASDCSTDRCFLKGCVYQDHMTLDQPRGSSLPGLPSEEGPGSVVAQEYLTRVLCEFTHEKSVRQKDVEKLARRLEKRLSHGWLAVTVTPEALEPIPKSLSEPIPEPEPPKEEEPPPEPEEDPVLTFDRVVNELWEALVPHTPWMTAIFLLTLSILIFIWAGRRLGAQSLEDKLLEARMQNGEEPEPEPEPEEAVEEPEAPKDGAMDEQFAEEQEKLWADRLDKIKSDDDDVISQLLREWLKAGDYPTLARALLVFGDRVSSAFESSPELALKKVGFAAYFRDVDEAKLPSRARFFRHLNQQAMASMLLSQEDVQLYRSLREDFGANGFVSLMRDLPGRFAALLFALVDYDQQQEVAALLSPALRTEVASQLLSSTRISMAESQYLSVCVEAVRVGEELPTASAPTAAREHGPVIESARALSLLLPHLSSAERQGLFAAALERHGGAMPSWYEEIAFNHMLTMLPEEVRNDLLLEIDVRGLSAWLQTQPSEWRHAFTRELSGPLQNALLMNTVTSSRPELIRWAKRGHDGIVTALKATYERKGVRFVDLVG